jgi:hypothetical protein
VEPEPEPKRQEQQFFALAEQERKASGSDSGSGSITGLGSGSFIKWKKKQKINTSYKMFLGSIPCQYFLLAFHANQCSIHPVKIFGDFVFVPLLQPV